MYLTRGPEVGDGNKKVKRSGGRRGMGGGGSEVHTFWSGSRQ